jgi:molecular chaperone Hsp33
MTQPDLLLRFIFEKAPIRGEYVQLTESFKTIMSQHDYPPPIRRLMGEALCVAALLCASIKYKGRLTVQFRGKGKLKFLLAQCDYHFHIRGLAKWEGDLSYDDLMEAFHDGVLMIMLDSGSAKNRYQGIVAWRGNSLIESVEGYFRDSEQLTTKILLAVSETAAVGYLLQVLPAPENFAETLEKEIVNPHWGRIAGMTSNMASTDLLALNYESLLMKTYPGEEIRVFSPESIMFHCNCSRKKGEDAIYVLGEKEAEEELKGKNSIEVTCDFCNKRYVFDRIDVAKIFADRNLPPSETHLH